VSSPIDVEHLQQWIGKSETTTDTVSAAPITALRATLDYPSEQIDTGHRLPALWHWLYFLPMARQSELSTDGHPARGGFLPPVPLPRRMWAGSQLDFHEALHVGEHIERCSTIENVTHKHGKSGELMFVRVKHQINRLNNKTSRTPAITEFHDIVYRQAANAATASTKPKERAVAKQVKTKRATTESADWEYRINVNDVLLFRYSALTFNAHRIHYDRRYATEAEGYPGLIVHGPLIATLLLDRLRKQLQDPIITHYEFKAIKPMFDIYPFYVCGATNRETNSDTNSDNTVVRLWAKDHHGDITMQAFATIN